VHTRREREPDRTGSHARIWIKRALSLALENRAAQEGRGRSNRTVLSGQGANAKGKVSSTPFKVEEPCPQASTERKSGNKGKRNGGRKNTLRKPQSVVSREQGGEEEGEKVRVLSERSSSELPLPVISGAA